MVKLSGMEKRKRKKTFCLRELNIYSNDSSSDES